MMFSMVLCVAMESLSNSSHSVSYSMCLRDSRDEGSSNSHSRLYNVFDLSPCMLDLVGHFLDLTGHFLDGMFLQW